MYLTASVFCVCVKQKVQKCRQMRALYLLMIGHEKCFSFGSHVFLIACRCTFQCKVLEQRMEQGMLLTEYEQVPKRRSPSECTFALLQENGERNRFQDVLPYDSTRVELVPTKENNTGYINASHIKVSGPEAIIRLYQLSTTDVHNLT